MATCLTEIFYSEWYVGIPPTRSPLSSLLKLLNYLYDGKYHVALQVPILTCNTADMPGFNSWRCTTLAQILPLSESITTDQETKLATDTAWAIENALCELLDLKYNRTRYSTIEFIIQAAIKFVKMCQMQRPLFEFYLPRISTRDTYTFDSTFMHDINEGDGLELDGKPVAMVLFPAIYKHGDECGENVVAHVTRTRSRLD